MNTQVRNGTIRKALALTSLVVCTLAATHLVGSSDLTFYTLTEATLGQVIADQGNAALRQIKEEAKLASRDLPLPELARESVTESAEDRVADSELGLAIASQGNQALHEIREDVAHNSTLPALPEYVPQESVQVAKAAADHSNP